MRDAIASSCAAESDAVSSGGEYAAVPPASDQAPQPTILEESSASAPALPRLDSIFAGEPTVTDPVLAAQPTDLDDPWAHAFAESSRIGIVVPPPTYPVVVNEHVQRHLERFTGARRDVVGLWAGRAGRYLAMIREVLRSKGMPEELAYTAMIESGFNPFAVSRAGAKGMWQFMAGTARRYGLRVDRWIDERLDPEKSTIAAAAYLADLYRLFGSWMLAQAAYNAGEMKVARAIRLTGSNDFWDLAESRYLRQETKEFVPQIQAATLIGLDPERYGFEFPEHEPPAIEVVTVPAGTSLARIADRTSIPLQTLKTLNPTLVRGVTPPGASWELRIPDGERQAVLAALAPTRRTGLVARASARSVVRASRPASGIHVVRPRDTISGIAKRYGVSTDDVVRWNGLQQAHRIRPGDRLRVVGSAVASERASAR